MRKIAFEIVAAVDIINNTRQKYLHFKERLELNTDRKLHERIFQIYSIAVPELINGIFSRLGFKEWVIHDEHFILSYKSILNDVESLWQIQEAYAALENKKEVEMLCDNLTKFVWDAVDSLRKLETTL